MYAELRLVESPQNKREEVENQKLAWHHHALCLMGM